MVVWLSVHSFSLQTSKMFVWNFNQFLSKLNKTIKSCHDYDIYIDSSSKLSHVAFSPSTATFIFMTPLFFFITCVIKFQGDTIYDYQLTFWNEQITMQRDVWVRSLKNFPLVCSHIAYNFLFLCWTKIIWCVILAAFSESFCKEKKT